MVRHDFVGKIAQVFAGYRSILSPRRSAIQLVIALLNLISAWATLYLLLRAAGLNTNIWLVAGFVPLLQLVNSLPFLYMGWGGREIAMAATLGAASNLTVNETLAVSIAWGVVLIMTGAVNGIFLLGDWRIAGDPRPRRTARQAVALTASNSCTARHQSTQIDHDLFHHRSGGLYRKPIGGSPAGERREGHRLRQSVDRKDAISRRRVGATRISGSSKATCSIRRR